MQGRDFTGADCYGLVYLFFADHGCTLPRYNFSYTMEERTELFQQEKPLLLGDEIDTFEDFAIVLFYRGNFPVHMGVYYDGGILHTTSATNSVYEKANGQSLKRFRKMEIYRVKDYYTTSSV